MEMYIHKVIIINLNLIISVQSTHIFSNSLWSVKNVAHCHQWEYILLIVSK